MLPVDRSRMSNSIRHWELMLHAVVRESGGAHIGRFAMALEPRGIAAGVLEQLDQSASKP